MSDNFEGIEPLPWEGDPQQAAFFVGYQMGLERALEALADDELPKIAGVKVAKLAIETVMLGYRSQNYARAFRVAANAGKPLDEFELAITATGVLLRPLDLVERAAS